MKNPVFDQIIQAIDEHRVLRVTDEAGARAIEPYLVFESAQGDMLLHGWQRAGAFRHTPPPRWCNLHIDDIEAIEILAERFAQPHGDYNPRSPLFHRVLYACDRSKPRAVPRRPEARVRRERRGPPKARTARSSPRAPRRK